VSNIAELSISQVAEYLQKFGLVKQWFDAAEQRVKDSINNGEEVPGWKIVESRSIRKVTDQGLAIQRLKTAGFKDEQVLKTSLISLTEIEKLIGKKNVAIVLDGCITKAPGNPTLVQSSDPRPPMTPLKETILNAF
jgi:hypothetical protein